MNKDDNTIYSTSFTDGKRTYFFEVKQAKNSDRYLKISERKRNSKGEFERFRIMVFEENITKFEEAFVQTLRQIKSEKPVKAYDVQEIRQTHRNAYKPWTEQDDDRLELLYCEKKSIQELAEIFGRNRGAIRSRIEKLELEDKYGSNNT